MTGVPPEVKLMSARELFAASRRASDDAEYLKRRLDRMESAEGVRGASLSPAVSGSHWDVNGTARVCARIDFEAATHARMEADYAVIDYACAVLYGADGRSGLAVLAGPRTADLLWYRYLDGRPWTLAASAVGLNLRTAQRKADEALDLVDFLTPEVVMAGEGAAEDAPRAGSCHAVSRRVMS